jgi:hypothetical protein
LSLFIIRLLAAVFEDPGLIFLFFNKSLIIFKLLAILDLLIFSFAVSSNALVGRAFPVGAV